MIVARANKPSRGLTVVAVLICLFVLTIVSGAVLKVGFARRELARAQERRLQAIWLVESGVQRARARLAQDRDYRGETWSLAARDFGQSEQPPAGARPPHPKRRRPSSRSRSSARQAIRSAGAARSGGLSPDLPRRMRETKEIMIDLEPSSRGAVP